MVVSHKLWVILAVLLICWYWNGLSICLWSVVSQLPVGSDVLGWVLSEVQGLSWGHWSYLLGSPPWFLTLPTSNPGTFSCHRDLRKNRSVQGFQAYMKNKQWHFYYILLSKLSYRFRPSSRCGKIDFTTPEKDQQSHITKLRKMEIDENLRSFL